MKKNISKLFIKIFLLCLPFLVFLFIYFSKDPFMVLRNYKNYDKSNFFQNEHYLGWKTYMDKRDSVHYNSYIFGNSCTMAFKCKDWVKYLGKDASGIRLFGSSESLIAVLNIMKALDRNHAEIKNVLFIIDTDLLGKIVLSNNNIVYLLPPEESGISNLRFQMCFIQAFFRPKYFMSYLDYNIFHHLRKYMRGVINPFGASVFNIVTRDLDNPKENEIAKEGDRYWTLHKREFPSRSKKLLTANIVLYEGQIKILSEIDSLCRKHHTDIRVVVSPLYHQVKLNPRDLSELQSIFGRDKVFDFSGINPYTSDIHNYYDKEHYRPILGNLLLSKIYGKPEK